MDLNSAQWILGQVDRGQYETGWAVFKYNIVWALFCFVVRVFIVCFMLFMSASLFGFIPFFSYEDVGDPATHQSVGFFIGLTFLGFSLWALSLFLDLLFMNSNVIVMTDKMLIKRHRGRVKEYPWEIIGSLTEIMVIGHSVFPHRKIRFVDRRNNRQVQLVKSRYFGSPQAIFQNMKTRMF